VITPWIDIILGRLIAGDCALSMTDSTTAEGGMRKSNFVEPNEHPVQAKTRVVAARKYASIFMDADIKGYSQRCGGTCLILAPDDSSAAHTLACP